MPCAAKPAPCPPTIWWIPAPRNSKPTLPISIRPMKTGQEVVPADRKKVIILGGGPTASGRGIEFDYCCCHASFALKDAGVQAIMVNSNPETVSTDYDTSDRLYFEPLTFEDVMHIVEKERPRRRDRPVRRPDAAEPRRAAVARGRAHPRHQPGRHRPRRRPRTFFRLCSRSCRFSSPPTARRPRWKNPARSPTASAIPL